GSTRLRTTRTSSLMLGVTPSPDYRAASDALVPPARVSDIWPRSVSMSVTGRACVDHRRAASSTVVPRPDVTWHGSPRLSCTPVDRAELTVAVGGAPHWHTN